MVPAPLILTVDVEEWAQSSWDRDLPLTGASARQCEQLLAILADFPSARATFFVLGKFAEKHPHLVAEIADAGHEVACHGYGHVEIFRMTRDTFAEDVRISTDLVAAAGNIRPVGFRAPDFSIVRESLWALDVIAESGYEYDSSIFPIAKKRYGIPGWPPLPARVALECGLTIVELPVATMKAGSRRLPLGGGGYARLLPGAILEAALRHVCREAGNAPVFYCHPYELDADELNHLEFPLPLQVRLHQGMGRRRTERKLRRLLNAFRCVSAREGLRGVGDMVCINAGQFVCAMEVDRPSIRRALS